MRRFLAGALVMFVALAVGPPEVAVAASQAPTLTVTPTTGLMDGQGVRLSADGFYSFLYHGEDWTPEAYACPSGAFPSSVIYPNDQASTAYDQLTAQCLHLTTFPVTGDYSNDVSPTAVNVTVHTGFVSGNGSSVACGQTADQCVLVAFGIAPDGVALESVPISFASAPKTPPGAPTGVVATSDGRSVTLAWKAPASDGGSPITGYTVTPYIGAVAQPRRTFRSTDTTQVLTHLCKHKTYTFRVAANNAIGTGVRSAPSNAVHTK